MSDLITLTHEPSVHTAVVRRVVRPEELSRFVPAACGEVWSFFRTAGLPRPGRHVALYLNGGVVEAGAEVPEPFTGNDQIVCSSLPGGRVATVTHLGPYAGLADAHSQLRRWCSEHGHRMSGVCWEVYGHWDTSWNEDPSRIRTDVFHLLQG